MKKWVDNRFLAVLYFIPCPDSLESATRARDGMAELQKPTPGGALDLKAVQETYVSGRLPIHPRYGDGRRFRFGQTTCDIYPAPSPTEGLTPVAHIRGRRCRLTIGDVHTVTPLIEQGLYIAGSTDAIWMKQNGNFIHQFTSGDPEPKPLTTQVQETI